MTSTPTPPNAWGRPRRRRVPLSGELISLHPDVVIVAAIHSELSRIACEALAGGCHVLVEKPAGASLHDVEAIREAAAASGKLVKVGFNHRFHPGIERAVSEAMSGSHGPVMFMRARYGHGGRIGYEREWRADPARSAVARSSIRVCTSSISPTGSSARCR